MQLIRNAFEVGDDVRCPVCGQGFRLYWTRKSPHDQAALVSLLMEALGRQHTLSTGPEAHSSDASLELKGWAPPMADRYMEAQWGYC